VGTIRPESSWSYNAAIEVTPAARINGRFLVFRNDVTDLIETSVIGLKTDGENIFTYWNVGKVLTQGFEAEIGVDPSRYVSASVGYQYLVAERKRSGEPLAGRSRHSGKLQLTLKEPRTGISTFVSAVYKSRYPFVTGTNIRVDGYSIWDIAASKSLWRGVSLKIGANNLFGHKDPTFLPSLSGTEWFISLNVNT
jgi:outer membrane receptor for ferrienterochelin and colicins